MHLTQAWYFLLWFIVKADYSSCIGSFFLGGYASFRHKISSNDQAPFVDFLLWGFVITWGSCACMYTRLQFWLLMHIWNYIMMSSSNFVTNYPTFLVFILAETENLWSVILYNTNRKGNNLCRLPQSAAVAFSRCCCEEVFERGRPEATGKIYDVQQCLQITHYMILWQKWVACCTVKHWPFVC